MGIVREHTVELRGVGGDRLEALAEYPLHLGNPARIAAAEHEQRTVAAHRPREIVHELKRPGRTREPFTECGIPKGHDAYYGLSRDS